MKQETSLVCARSSVKPRRFWPNDNYYWNLVSTSRDRNRDQDRHIHTKAEMTLYLCWPTVDERWCDGEMVRGEICFSFGPSKNRTFSIKSKKHSLSSCQLEFLAIVDSFWRFGQFQFDPHSSTFSLFRLPRTVYECAVNILGQNCNRSELRARAGAEFCGTSSKLETNIYSH